MEEKEIEEPKVRNVVIAALIPLLTLSICYSVATSISINEVTFMGVLVAIYYAVPTFLFAFAFASLLNALAREKLLVFATSLMAQIVLGVVLGLVFLTLWVVFRGSTYNYHGMGFWAYWMKEAKFYWIPLVSLSIPIPIIMNLLTRRGRRTKV